MGLTRDAILASLVRCGQMRTVSGFFEDQILVVEPAVTTVAAGHIVGVDRRARFMMLCNVGGVSSARNLFRVTGATRIHLV